MASNDKETSSGRKDVETKPSTEREDQKASGKTVSDVMTSDPQTVTREDSLQQAAQLMVDCDCGAIPVVESKGAKRVIGMITDRDIVVRVVAKGQNPAQSKVSDAMSDGIHTVRQDDPLDKVVQLMADKKVRRVPVVNAKNELCGIVALADVANVNQDRKVGQMVEEISEPASSRRTPTV